MHSDFAEVQRQIRLSFAPAADDPDAVWRTCLDCGTAYLDWVAKDRRRCADCSAERGRRQRQANAERWRKAAPAGER